MPLRTHTVPHAAQRSGPTRRLLGKSAKRACVILGGGVTAWAPDGATVNFRYGITVRWNWAHPLPHLRRDRARLLSTSARGWAYPSHICTATTNVWVGNHCAPGTPCSAAFEYHTTAWRKSFGTPSPRSNSTPRLYCAPPLPCRRTRAPAHTQRRAGIRKCTQMCVAAEAVAADARRAKRTCASFYVDGVGP